MLGCWETTLPRERKGSFDLFSYYKEVVGEGVGVLERPERTVCYPTQFKTKPSEKMIPSAVGRVTDEDSGGQGLNPQLAMESHWGSGTGKITHLIRYLKSPIRVTLSQF